MLAQSLQPLYKMDSKGKIRVLTVSYGSDERGSFYEQEHGLLDGKLQTSRTYVAGKNAGKANATTDEEQAEKEAESKRAKKRDRGGYSESIPEDKPMMPMLAQSHDKHGHKIKYPAYVQPKLDGIRCFVHVDGESVTLKSRTGKEFTSLDHIADAVRELVSVIVPTFPVENLDEVVEQNSLWLEDGYEGSMIRNSKGGYQPNRRSPDLQKYKSFMDAEFEIVGAVENKGKMEGQCTFTCVTEDGTEFGCKPMGDESQREQYWIDFQAGKLTGKMLTVKFFEWTTSENPVPRFPVGVIVRDYED